MAAVSKEWVIGPWEAKFCGLDIWAVPHPPSNADINTEPPLELLEQTQGFTVLRWRNMFACQAGMAPGRIKHRDVDVDGLIVKQANDPTTRVGNSTFTNQKGYTPSFRMMRPSSASSQISRKEGRLRR